MSRKLVLSHWAQFAPSERSQATEFCYAAARGRWRWPNIWIKENIRITTLDPAHVAQLGELSIRQRFGTSLASCAGRDRPTIARKCSKSIAKVALANGDAAQGKQVFEKNCSTCHEMGGVGNAVGPNLAAMVSRGTESVLLNVLAPNAEVDPRFLEYVVLTNDGQVITGVIAGETSTAVTIRGPENKTTTVLRVDIDDMHNDGKIA